NLGGVGTYSTVFVEDPSGIERALTNPLVSTLLTAALPPVVRNALTVATADDPLRAAVGMLGGQYINDALVEAGVTGATLGLSPEQFESAVNSTVEGVAQGEDLGEAVVSSFGKEIVSNVDIDLPEFNVDLASFGLDIDTPEAIKQLEDVIKEGGSAVADVIRTGGEALQPLVQPIVDAASDIGRPIEDVVREVGSTAEDILEPVKDPILDALEMGIDLASMEGINMDGTYRPSASGIPTQVEELFGKELFKFETEIGISPELFEYEEFYDRDLMPRRQQPRIYSF
ncbi:MAG: hypothetical protein ACXABN_18725, partial [Candidatus Thorarchaeota archaeon]